MGGTSSDDVVERFVRFGREEVATRGDLHRRDDFPRDLWRAMGEAGLFAVGLAPEHGGSGLSLPDQTRAGEALVREGLVLGVSVTWQTQVRHAAFIVARHGDERQRAEWLPRITRGELATCLAVSEPGRGAHPKHLETRAVRDGEDWVISGEKAWLTNGPLADLFLVLAITAEEGGRKRFSLFAVPETAGGVERTESGHIDWLKPASHCGLSLERVRVGPEAIVGVEGEAFEAIARPFRDHEDLTGFGIRIGGMAAEVTHLAKAGVERVRVGGLAVDVDGMRVLYRDALDEGDPDVRRNLLLALKRAARRFQEEVSELIEGADGLDPRIPALARDLEGMGGVARYVERIHLDRIGGAIAP